MSKIITVSGSIGVGKTTLCKELSLRLPNAKHLDENAEHNPYISDFFHDKTKWAFHSRIAFLYQKLQDYKECESLAFNYYIIDRSFDELLIFATNLYKRGEFDNRDFTLYSAFVKLCGELIRRDEYTVYLYCKPETSLYRIKKRNNLYENFIDIGYINDLRIEYDCWISRRENVIRINTDADIDYDHLLETILQ